LAAAPATWPGSNWESGPKKTRGAVKDPPFLWGNRPVEVDQSYIDELHNAHHRESELADHNYKAATDWRNEALGLRVALADREAVIKQTDRNLASCKDTLQQERARYNKKTILFIASYSLQAP
jgi:hypothetical protein